MVCSRRCIVTLVAFVWFNNDSSCFLREFYIFKLKYFPFVWSQLCSLLCWNGCFKLSWIWLKLSFGPKVFHDILSLFTFGNILGNGGKIGGIGSGKSVENWGGNRWEKSVKNLSTEQNNYLKKSSSNHYS